MNRTIKVTVTLFASLVVAFIGWQLAANQLAASYLEGRFHADVDTLEHLLPIAKQLRSSNSDSAREVEDLLDLRAVSGSVSAEREHFDRYRRKVVLDYIAYRKAFPTPNTETAGGIAKAIARYEYLLNQRDGN